MSSHSRKYALLIVLLIGASPVAWANETTWPQIDQATDSGMCSDAFKMAESAYRSDNFYLYELPSLPGNMNSRLVLWPSAFDISGGDALMADKSVFEKIPKDNQDGNDSRSIYWQSRTSHGLRYVMNEDAFGWRGDQYTLFAISDDITADDFIEGYSRNLQEAVFTPLIGEGWRPPLMMQEKNTKNVWAVDVGAPYLFLSDWVIYSIGTDGAKANCTIRFHPTAETATALLPAPVRKLARFLDGTLGSGENEGTLQPTAHARLQAMHTWANVAMRPWAIASAEPYNTREQVETELEKWASKAKSFRKLHQDIATQYPKAEHALAGYYETQFNKNADDAAAMAKQALDIAFRTYFVFSK